MLNHSDIQAINSVEELKQLRAELDKQYEAGLSNFKSLAARRDSEGKEIRNTVKVKLEELTSLARACNNRIIELSHNMIGAEGYYRE